MAKNITATANGTTVSGNNLKYVVSNLGSNIKSVTYNGTEYWKAYPEYLYNAGDEVTDFTGGWVSMSKVMANYDGWDGRVNGNNSKGSNYLELQTGTTGGSGQYNGSGYATRKTVDFSEINKLTFNLSLNEGGDVPYQWWKITLCSSVGGTINKIYTFECRYTGSTFSVDTSGYNGSYVLAVNLFTSDGYWSRKRISSIKVN